MDVCYIELYDQPHKKPPSDKLGTVPMKTYACIEISVP